MSTAELDAQVLGHVTDRPGSTVWDLCKLFPWVPGPEPEPERDGGMFHLPPPPPRDVPSVTPVQIVGSLARLKRDGRVRVTRDPGPGGAERWHALDY